MIMIRLMMVMLITEVTMMMTITMLDAAAMAIMMLKFFIFFCLIIVQSHVQFEHVFSNFYFFVISIKRSSSLKLDQEIDISYYTCAKREHLKTRNDFKLKMWKTSRKILS